MRRALTGASPMLLLSLTFMSARQPPNRQDIGNEATGSGLKVAAQASELAPRLADGTPDLSGVWFGGGPTDNIESGLAPGETLLLLPEARKLWAARLAKDDPVANCLPTGVLRITFDPWRIIQTPSHIFFLFEGDRGIDRSL